MSQLQVFIILVIGTVTYQGFKFMVGLPITLETSVDAIYWGGAALSLHWFANHSRSTTR